MSDETKKELREMVNSLKMIREKVSRTNENVKKDEAKIRDEKITGR